VWVDAEQGVAATVVDPEGPAASAGVRSGDVLTGISLDGGYTFDSITEANLVQFYLDQAGVGSSTVSYLIQRHSPFGGTSQWAADLEKIVPEPQKLWRGIYLALVGLVYLIVGLYVLIRQRRASHTIHFYLICLSAFVVYFFSLTRELDRLDWVVFYADTMALILLAPLFLHFCAVFPEKRKTLQRHRWLAALVYVPAVVMLVLEIGLSTFLKLSSTQVREWRVALDLIEEKIQFPVCFLGGAALLLYTFLKAQTPMLKQQMKWVVCGLGGIVPFTGFLIYTHFARTTAPPIVEALAIGPLLLIPLSFGYSIVRYRLMDVDVIMRRSFVHLTTTAAMAGLYIIVLVAVSDFVAQVAPPWVTQTMVVVGTLLVAMLFAPLKNYIQVRIDRLFYGERYRARVGVTEFARMLSTMTALEPLLQKVSQRLQAMLLVDRIALFVRDEAEPSGYRVAHVEGIEEPLPLPASFAEFVHAQGNGHQIISLDESDRYERHGDTGTRGHGEDEPLAASPTRPLAPSPDLRYFVPCVVRDHTIAVIGLGRTREGELLSSEDIELLRTIAPYIAIAIENSTLYREQAERAKELASLKEFNESIIESINVGILAVDPQGIITTWNSALEELLEIDRARVIGKPVHQVFEPQLVRALRNVIGGSGWAVSDPRTIYKFRTVAGHKELMVNVTVTPFEMKEGLKVGSLIVVEDITQRQQLEAQLQQSEKLSSIGLLAAGVAHEVNTPLTGISSYAQMLLKQLPKTDPRYKLLEKIEDQAERASTIVNNLLNFSRTDATEFVHVDIHKILDDTLQLVEPQLRGMRLSIVKRYGADLPGVAGNATKLQQVFMNLILNARDAMPGGGTLTIETYLSDSMVGIDIVDTGVGIPPEHIRRIYDPFFTTKGTGRGTGLGLAISYGIIREHAGDINVESQVGRGTRFSIYLPFKRQAQVARRAGLRLASGD
jgi:hypothetical protein